MFKLEYCEEIRNISVYPDGWYGPLNIIYGFMKSSGDNILLWNVEGTSHLFRTPLKYVTSQHGPRYEEHFKLTLETFREDILSWEKLGLPEDWMKNYYKEFNLLIRY